MSGFEPRGSLSVVTGAASGIGRALCVELARRGAKAIVAVDLDLAGCHVTCTLASRAASVSSSNSNSNNKNNNNNNYSPLQTLALQGDVSREQDIIRIIQETEAHFGPNSIDCFICNAGILMVGKGVSNTSNEEWNKIMGVNVMQSVYVARHMIPRWIEQKQKENNKGRGGRSGSGGGGGGALLIVASAAGLLTQIGSLPYGVTKNAAVAVADWIAVTHGRQDNIHVSCLCPQAVRTAMTTTGNVDKHQGMAMAAGMDGMLEAEQVAQEAIDGMVQGKYMILPHQRVKTYFQHKASDYDRWIQGMQRLNDKIMNMNMKGDDGDDGRSSASFRSKL